MDCSTPVFPVHHQLSELAQTHVHGVGDAIQPSHPVVPFSSCLQSFPASGYFPMSQFSTSGGKIIAISSSASVLPMKFQAWFPLRLTGLISLQFKGLSWSDSYMIPGGSVVKNSPANAGGTLGDVGWIPGWVGKIPWRRKWQHTQIFLIENPMVRRAWWATVHGVAKSPTWLSRHKNNHRI